MGDGLMAYTAYAFLFISLFNSATNLQQIGREVLIGIHPLDDPNRDLLRFIGVVALTVICFIQLFSARAGRVLNGLFALIKIAFLFVLLCFGWHYLSVNGPAPDFEAQPTGISALGYAQALLIVLYSYEGWENANFVSGIELMTKIEIMC
jgi:amino acid transporter